MFSAKFFHFSLINPMKLVRLTKSFKFLALWLLQIFLSVQVHAQAPAAVNSFVPAAGVSKTIIEPNGLGAVTVVPVSPTVIPLGLQRYGGPTANNAGTKQMSANRIVLPPGARGPRNMHKNAETVIMIIQGNLTTLIGADGEKTLTHKAGDFLHVPGDIWHQWVNRSKTEEVVLIEMRADANDNSNLQIIPTP